MILKEKFSLSPFFSPTTPKNVFSLKCGEFVLAHNQFNFSYTVNCKNLLEASPSHALPCRLHFRNQSFIMEDDLQSCSRNHISAQKWQALPQKKCLQTFEHPYILSFTITSVLLFLTVLTKSRICNCENFRSEYFSWVA